MNTKIKPHDGIEILVIGGNGFVGKNIIKMLINKGYRNVRSMDLSEYGSQVKTYIGNITVLSDLEEAMQNADIVIHAASPPPSSDEELLMQVIIEGTKNVVNACRKCNVGMLIYTSSASIVCDIERDVIFADETYPTCPNSSDPYRKSKSIAEHIVLKANSRELMTVSLRPSIIYGKGDSFTSKITWLGEKGLSRFAQIGPGTNIVDFVHVENVAHAHVLTMERMLVNPDGITGESFFVTDGQPMHFWNYPKYVWDSRGEPLPLFYWPLWIILLLCFVLNIIFGLHRILCRTNGKRFRGKKYLRDMIYSRTFSIRKVTHALNYKPVANIKTWTESLRG